MSTSPLPPGRQQSKSNLNPEEARKILTEEHIGRLTEEAIQKLAEYTRKQALATVEDCQLLETMNKMTKDKYSQLSSMSQRLIQEMSKIQDTQDEFDTFAAQVDEIDQQITQMEKIARSLDEYSRYLEDKLERSK
ncbi:hypothetical protein VTP01DRAFT_3628 [Rhizomucor pusillus]|uniref:uncharacterized protein n=1 Tax=Rhizomucor pusillus TaxID=4840 RepID=UPI003744A1BE